MKRHDDIAPDRGMFWLSIKWLAFGAALLLIGWLFVLPLFAGGKVIGREARKFDAETSAQVYDNSRQYQQGTNRDLARYCRDYAEAPEGAKRKILEGTTS